MTFKDVFAAILALCIVALFGGVFAILLLHPIALTEGASALVNMAFGFLGAAFGAVVTFYYGSSASSQTKDATINQLATTAAGTGNGNPLPHNPQIQGH